jgi:NADPH:quinone reductase-like Zn-dependent oxidoreductase
MIRRCAKMKTTSSGRAVGGYAVQLAKHAADRLRDYGADRIIDYIDYTATPIDVKGQIFDVVLNLVGTSPEETAALVGVVADGGFHVGTMTSGTADPARGVRTQRMFVRSDATQLADLVGRVDAGNLQIDIADRRPLPAHRRGRRARCDRLLGKTILVPADQ